MAVANYHEDYGVYPPAYIADEKGTPIHSWRVLLLPYIEQRELYAQYDFTKPWNDPVNLKIANQMPQTYMLHGDFQPGMTTTNYLVVTGESTVWPDTKSMSHEQVTDDPGSTIQIVENLGLHVHWMEPRDLSLDSMSFQINDPAGVSSKYESPAVVMVDGRITQLDKDLPTETLKALLTATGGEQLQETDRKWKLLQDGRDRKEAKPAMD